MDKRGCLYHIGVNAAQAVGFFLALFGQQFFRDSSTDLRNFKGMRQAVMKDNTFSRRNYLGYVCQSPPSCSV